MSSTIAPVLFVAVIDTRCETLPYAKISEFSEYPQEEEVLFMFGTIFKIHAVYYRESSGIWEVKLSLCGDDDPRLIDMVNYIKHEIKDTADLVTLGDLFIKMGEYDKAKEFYCKYQSRLSINDPNLKRVWQGLSNIADIEGNYYISMYNYTKAHECFDEQLKICRNLPSRHPQYGKCYSSIANLYELEGEKKLALENYQKAYKIYIQSLPAYHPDTTKVEQSIENLSPQNKITTQAFNQPIAPQMSEEKSKANTNMETFLIVWLDANINKTKDNEDTYKALRTSVNYLKTFDNLQEGETYIRSIQREKIILIVSGGYGRAIVPRIHDLVQVNCIYVYCVDKAYNEAWSKDYSKIRSVITKRKQLIDEITEDQKLRNIIEDIVPMSILNRTAVAKETTAKNISKEMGSILWFQLLVDVLLRMTHTEDAKIELMKTWRENYIGNSSELHIIKEFERDYKQEKAVWWYTRQSSLYRILNKALREQSIDTIFAFRFFLTELSEQVTQLYYIYMNQLNLSNTKSNDEYIIYVYRGQVIAKEELEQMQTSIGGFISINSFFSTSRSESKARDFAKLSEITDKLRRILFKIKIDPRLPTKPFADIEGISYFPDEREILFMLGSIFRIDEINYDNNDALWTINMSLCSEDDFELKELFAYLKKDIGEEASMVTLGNILLQMGEYDKAKRIFLRMNHQQGLISVAELKGNFYLAMKHYKHAIDCYEQALKLRGESLPASHQDIAKSYSSIAMPYEFWKTYPKAIDYYQRTIKQYSRTLKDNHPLITQTKTSLLKLQHRTNH
ncbi:unnamed protein product [Rotaria sp. Silwood1]|nr:unnamed protein product [Rotaria sp. Silwood1]CAF1557664.1 unnamed protein product [Rotaria sp. Silwood1]